MLARELVRKVPGCNLLAATDQWLSKGANHTTHIQACMVDACPRYMELADTC
jgi:hypothetical protein